LRPNYIVQICELGFELHPLAFGEVRKYGKRTQNPPLFKGKGYFAMDLKISGLRSQPR